MMEGEKEQKRVCSGNSVLEVDGGGLVDLKCDQQGSIDVHQGEMVAVGVGRGVPQVGDHLTVIGSDQQTELLSTDCPGSEGEERELRNLNVDLLAEVFSSLPQEDLVEVMVVCRHWETAMREGGVVWQNMRVHREWRRGSTVGEREKEGANQILIGALQAAEEVRYVNPWETDWKPLLSLGWMVAANLRILELPGNCFPADLFPAVLSNCPQLKDLAIDGEPNGQGSIHIRHPTLQTFKIRSESSRYLTVDCPNLTHLSTQGRVDRHHLVICPPSIQCPLLTNLQLSSQHCAPAALQLMAANAPLVKCLTVESSDECPSIALTHFTSVEYLNISECEEIAPRVFDHWSHLAELCINGEGFTIDSEIRHPRLRFLYLNDQGENVSVRLLCPSLEISRMHCVDLDAKCLTNLNDTCPMLKRLEVEWVKDDGEEDVTCHALDIVHETLEALKLYNCWCVPIQMIFQIQTLFRVVCPNLKSLILEGYTDMPRLPSILCTLPRLETLDVTLSTMHLPTVKLEHGQLQSLAIARGKIDKLVISMPKLDHLFLVTCMVKTIQVASREIVNFKFSHSRDGSNPLWRTIHPKMALVTAHLEDERDSSTEESEDSDSSESVSDSEFLNSFEDEGSDDNV